MQLLIEKALIVNEGRKYKGFVLIENEIILRVGEGEFTGERPSRVINAQGMILTPGVIDDQVHFREPGLTYKADIHSESRAAVAGGITSYMEMPNTKPAATTIDLLNQKFDIAAANSLANYSFYIGASNDNIEEIRRIDPKKVCGVKMFMGSSTGNMLVDDTTTIAAIFAESPVLVTLHCEQEEIVRANMEAFKAKYGENIEPQMHPLIRSVEACYTCSARAVEIADKYSANIHILHLSSAKELTLFERKPLEQKRITNEVCVHHLWFNDTDYACKGNMIKWNPAIKSESDRVALINGITNGLVDMVATDHAPHTLEEKSQSYLNAPSGGPLVQHSLVAMLEIASRGEITTEDVVAKMCHAPAVRFNVKERGFIREGYYADLVIVESCEFEVYKDNILYKCGWSPFEGVKFAHKVCKTIINGSVVYDNGVFDENFRGKELTFER